MSLMRKVLLAGSTNAWLRDHATQYRFVKRSVQRFWPGESADDALRAASRLRPDGITTILTKLGENLTRAEEAEEVTQHYLEVLDKVAASGLDAQISIKPTQLGLDFDRGLCERNLDRLIERADALGNFVWIDMESSPYVDRTILYVGTYDGTGTGAGQVGKYNAATGAAINASLIPLGAAIRIVKGAYLEPATVAFPKKVDVDANYFKLCTWLLSPEARKPGALLHIATHDIALADRIAAYIRDHNVPVSAYEFAMLYGIQRGQQLRLAREGRRLRVLISYGEYWFPWYMRRLAERPANMWFVVRTMFG